jgi:3-dehydroquinate synthase
VRNWTRAHEELRQMAYTPPIGLSALSYDQPRGDLAVAKLSVQLSGAQPDIVYPVYIAHDALETVRVPESSVAVVADEAVALLHAPQLVAALERHGSKVILIPVPSGERCKTLEVMGNVVSKLAQMGLTRDSAVVALGGGATSDLAGYAAASYLRGIAFYICPTSLLCVVDASVGGKTVINIPEGKNLVGAFHQPSAVWADLEVLASLPARTFREGAAEIFKHGLLTDAQLCDAVLEPGFNAKSPKLERVVSDAVQVKIDVVQRDPFETGERAFLNFGHTLAHALEAVTLHRLPHGEAVGYGMHFAALIGKLLGYEDLTSRTRAFLNYQKPAVLPTLELSDVMPFMLRDKKADSGGLRFVMLEKIGAPKLERVSGATVEEAWKLFASEFLRGETENFEKNDE